MAQLILGHLCDFKNKCWDGHADYFLCLSLIGRGYNPPDKTTCHKWLNLETLGFDFTDEEYEQSDLDIYCCKLGPWEAAAINRVDGAVGLDVHKVLTQLLGRCVHIP